MLDWMILDEVWSDCTWNSSLNSKILYQLLGNAIMHILLHLFLSNKSTEAFVNDQEIDQLIHIGTMVYD